jgi:Ca2+-binding EF-hand superfamily protein
MKITALLTTLLLSLSFATAADKADKNDPEAILKNLDTNKDGTVNKEEYLASKKAQKDPAKAGKRFDKADGNKDGKLSKEELAATAHGKKDEAPAPAAPGKPEEKKPAEQK